MYSKLYNINSPKSNIATGKTMHVKNNNPLLYYKYVASTSRYVANCNKNK